MKKTLLLLAIAGFGLTSCEKDEQKIVNKLVGTWKGENMIVYVNNVEDSRFSDDLGYLIFDDCEVKDNSFCDGNTKEQLSGTPSPFKYQIFNDGNKFLFDEDGNLTTTSDRTEYTIESVSATNLEVSATEIDNGDTVKSVLKLSKVN